MSKRVNKYLYVYVVQGYYGLHGWEDLCQSESYQEARHDLRAYRENEIQYPHRMIQRRISNPDYKEGYEG